MASGEHKATTTQETPGPLSERTTWVIMGVVFVLVVGMVALMVWALLSSGRDSQAAPGFERYQSGWESAMAKAGVEAQFPTGPVDVTRVRVSGRRPFEATFSAEEISALMSVYRYETTVSGETVSGSDAYVMFPEDGIGEMSVVLYARGSRYRAQVSAPVSYEKGEITSSGLTSLKVAGFTVTGANRTQAGTAFLVFLNRYLDSAPGLEVEEARIVRGGIEVRGTAPQRIEHPEPLSR